MTPQMTRSHEIGNPLTPPHGIYDVLKIVVEIYDDLKKMVLFLYLFICLCFCCCCCCCCFVVVVFVVSYASYLCLILDLIYTTIGGF